MCVYLPASWHRTLVEVRGFIAFDMWVSRIKLRSLGSAAPLGAEPSQWPGFLEEYNNDLYYMHACTFLKHISSVGEVLISNVKTHFI